MTTTYQWLTEFAQSAGSVYFLLFFLGTLAYVFWPKNRARFDDAARMPLREVGRNAGSDRFDHHPRCGSRTNFAKRATSRSTSPATTGPRMTGVVAKAAGDGRLTVHVDPRCRRPPMSASTS
jgi:cytochrome c oxidase cbb3-type subunit IV